MDSDKKLNGLKMTYTGVTSGDSGLGGAARVKNMVSLFKKMGIKIDLISYSPHPNKFGIKHKKINHLLQINIVNVPDNLPKFLKLFTIIPIFFYAWKSSRNSDIMYADFIGIATSVPIVILKKIFDKPIIMDYIDLRIKVVPNIIYKYMARNADVIFAISPFLLDSAKREYGCKNVTYLPNSIDINSFKMDWVERKKKRGELCIEKDEIVIGFVGSFWYVEGVPILLQAFKNLIEKHSKIKLAIMGKVRIISGCDNIPKLVEDMHLENDVILIPPQPHENVPKFLSAFDILCCPKIDCEINRAANPVKVPEYLSMGLPTVCSAVGGINDTIENGVDGLLVKPGDVNDLEEKLEWIILNPERAKEIGENGRKTAIEKYSYEAIEDTIRQMISEIINMKRNNGGRLK